MDTQHPVLQPAGANTASVWRNAEFVRATAIMQAQNQIRRAMEALGQASTPGKGGRLAETARALAQQRVKCLTELADMGMPSLTTLVALKIDVDQRHPVSVDIGLALCSLGAARIARIQSEVSRSLSELRTADIAVLLQACARLGWDRDIDRTIAWLRPGGETGHLGEALNWRIQREPWRITDHSSDWSDRLHQAHQIAVRIESEMLGHSHPHAELASMHAASRSTLADMPRMR